MADPGAILHVDMDAFFASVEVRDDPRLRGEPVLVGGAGARGVVAAASYEARVFGCRSAQPMSVALRLCPHAVVIPPRHDAYAAASRHAFEVFGQFSPLVEALSIDEAFLDLTGSERLLGSPRRAAESLRAAVYAATDLTCSVGIAHVKFLAKIASGMNKPNGITEIPAGTELGFLAPLPIGALWGVGPRTEQKLALRNIRTVADLRNLGEATLARWFGEHGRHLHRLSHAIDERTVMPDRAAKSIGHEDTYAVDVAGIDDLRRHLLSQATRVADRLVAQHQRARTVHLKIRDDNFVTETRQCTLAAATDDHRDIHRAACRLLAAVETDGRKFRLTGVSVAGFEAPPAATQLDLLGTATNSQGPTTASAPRNDAVQAVLSAVRERFGHQALYPADAGAERRPGTTGAITRSPDRGGRSK